MITIGTTHNGNYYFFGGSSREVNVIDPENGTNRKLREKKDLYDLVNKFNVIGDKVYLYYTSGLEEYNPESGEIKEILNEDVERVTINSEWIYYTSDLRKRKEKYMRYNIKTGHKEEFITIDLGDNYKFTRDDQFNLTKNYFYYRNSTQLIRVDLKTKKETVICENVLNVAYEGEEIYLIVKENESKNFVYHIDEDGSKTKTSKGAVADEIFMVYDGVVYCVNDKRTQILACSKKKDFNEKEFGEIDGGCFYMQANDSYGLFQGIDDSAILLNKTTGEVKTLNKIEASDRYVLAENGIFYMPGREYYKINLSEIGK